MLDEEALDWNLEPAPTLDASSALILPSRLPSRATAAQTLIRFYRGHVHTFEDGRAPRPHSTTAFESNSSIMSTRMDDVSREKDIAASLRSSSKQNTTDQAVFNHHQKIYGLAR